MLSRLLALLAAFTLSTVAALAASMSEPAVSPDGREIAFVSGGDIWSVPAGGGEARLLVSHPANETRPSYSPDGSRIAFVSDRTGNGDVYLLTLASGKLTRLTFDDAPDSLDGWSRDSRWIWFSSSAEDIAGLTDLYRVRASGGTPMRVSADVYTAEYFAAPSPDGKSVAFSARGIANSQWWRNGHSHIDESELWLLEDLDRPAYRQLTERGSKHLWPMWSPQGDRIYFMSDQGGAENLWMIASAGGQATQLTRFTSGRLLWPSIAADGSRIVFERDLRIFSFDPSTGAAAAVPITLRGAAAGPSVEHRTLNGEIEEVAVSPDGKKVAFIVHGEVYAASAKDGGNAARVTRTVAEEVHIRWAPDSRRLVYASARDGSLQIYVYDFAKQKEERLTTSPHSDFAPQFSPDGKLVAFLRNGRELRTVDPSSKKESAVLASGVFELPQPLFGSRSFTWSPDSRWIAYLSNGDRLFRNAHVIPVSESGAARQVSFVGNVNAESISWSPDGRFLAFDSGQRSEAGQVARVDLLPRTPKLREEQFRDLFRQETPESIPTKEKKPKESIPADEVAKDAPTPAKGRTEIVFDDIRRRLTLLPVGLDVRGQSISPDGKQLLLIASAAGQENLYLYSLDELAKEPPVAKQITSTSGRKSSAQWSGDGKEVCYLDDGKIVRVAVDTAGAKPLAVSAEIDIDFEREKMVMFRQAWTWMRQNFHDPAMNGTDWNAVGERTRAQVEAARTPDEVRRLLALMVGELNASHLGVRAGGNSPRTTGRLGLRFDRAEYEKNGRFRITGIVPLSPAAVTRKIAVGDYLLAVDGQPLEASTNLEQLLEHRIGKELTLTVASSATTSGREVVLQPVNLATHRQLVYRDWVERNRDYVRRISDGRLGYVHMFDMGSESLAQLLLDLDAENQTRDGVVVDIRNNNGGFVNAYALDTLTRQHYLNMTFRDLPTAPARTVLGQRALERPTILVTNQHSLSDAEDFSEGYRSLKLGKIVGEPTSGWIIYTSNVELIDGTVFRLPFITVTTASGERMEMAPRPVDVPVTRPIGESLTGRDSQLDRAVAELLAGLKGR